MSIKRRFISPGEKKEMLESYIEQLKKELAGAEAALKAFDTEA